MNDCLPESGGFVLVHIAADGIIRDVPPSYCAMVVHRESTGLHNKMKCTSFAEAKKQKRALKSEEYAILELTPEGAGMALWMQEDQIPELSARRNKWKGCYGAWPIHTLSV